MGSEDSEIILIFVSSATIIVVLAVLVVLFVVIYQKRLVAQEMRMQKLENDVQQELLQATIAGQERERSRLAKDLHDGIGSLLSGLKLNLTYQQSQVQDNEDQKRFLDEACNMLEVSITEVRRVSHDLLPVTLESFGLVVTLQEWTDLLQANSDFTVSLEYSGPERRMLPTIELGLLRVIQELLQNTIRHAEANAAHIVLAFGPNEVAVRYRDDGKGFDFANSRPGHGIKNMQSRIHALGGSIELNTESEAGFHTQLTVPTQ
jgi:signal transduction histidine kinase